VSPEAQRVEGAELVKIEVQTTATHAEHILWEAQLAVTDRARRLRKEQDASIEQQEFGSAVYLNHQINHCLTAAVAAQELLRKFTTQGEEEHGNEV
jgi:hypothetical protein